MMEQDETTWINLLFTDLKDEFRDDCVKIYPFTKETGPYGYVKSTGKNGFIYSEKYRGQILVDVNYFVEVREEIDKIQAVVNDYGYIFEFKVVPGTNVPYHRETGEKLYGTEINTLDRQGLVNFRTDYMIDITIFKEREQQVWSEVMPAKNEKKSVKNKKIIGFQQFNESNNNTQESNLLIIDVQKSFGPNGKPGKKYFGHKYVSQLQQYCKNYTNVYQIFDNHIDGKNVDKDFLYDENPDIPVHNDLYQFPNQKELIEKRYNYKVTPDYFKKILDKKTFKLIQKGGLKKGQYFLTTENTIIVYIGNNHNFFHCPKKLYQLFKKLKGQPLTVVGGSDSECLEDVFITAQSLGVFVKRDHRFIWSASHCPIK